VIRLINLEALPMRTLLAAVVAAPLMLFVQTDGASAQNYPWCAQYASPGSINCGFSTEQQCRAALSGNGGYCAENPLYHPEGAARRPRR